MTIEQLEINQIRIDEDLDYSFDEKRIFLHDKERVEKEIKELIETVKELTDRNFIRSYN